MKIFVDVKKFISLLLLFCISFFSCKKDVEISEEQNFIQAKVNGIDFRSVFFNTQSFFFNNQFKSTTISGKSEGRSIDLTFYKNDLRVGNYDFYYIHASDSSGILGRYANLNEMSDPENIPSYYSKSGNISISKIDTGTFEGKKGVIINLEATFNFTTDSIHGNPKTIENGEIYFRR